ncbi:MAG: peptidylprolyl isomerase [Phycisphaerae bacterium]|jgi:peptidylprolyl isomerase|nr:peptidylprolyl isomerase [Phycisphaerae bacterium]
MTQAKEGNTVKVHYTGKLEDGTIFDSSRDSEPLEFTLGAGQIIPGFEQAVIGMDIGDSKTVTIVPEQGYGNHMDEMVMSVKRDQLPPDLDPKVGLQLQSQQRNGQIVTFIITEVNESAITVDANHPLAGKTLIFDIELLDVA